MSNEAIPSLNVWTTEDFETALQTYAVEAPVTTTLTDLPEIIEVGQEIAQHVFDLETMTASKEGRETMATRVITTGQGPKSDYWNITKGDEASVSTIIDWGDTGQVVFDAHYHPENEPPSIRDALLLLRETRATPFASCVLSPEKSWLMVKTLDVKIKGITELREYETHIDALIWNRAQELYNEGQEEGDEFGNRCIREAEIEYLRIVCQVNGIGLYHYPRPIEKQDEVPVFTRFNEEN